MAFIKCPDCSAAVSDRAHNCPNCGYPLNRCYRPKTQADINAWYYEYNGQAIKISERELCEKIRNGSISSNVLVVNSDIKQWIPLKNTQIYINNVQTYNMQSTTASELDKDSGSEGIAVLALILSIISFFVLPIAFSVISVIASLISLAIEKKGHGIAVIAIFISLISVFLWYCMLRGLFEGLF